MDFVLPFSYALLGTLGFFALIGCGIAYRFRSRRKTAAKAFGAIGCLALIGVLYLGSSIFTDDPKINLKRRAWPAFRLVSVPLLQQVRPESESSGRIMTGLIAGIAELHDLAIEEYKLALLDTASAIREEIFYSLGGSYQSLKMHEEAIACFDSMLHYKRSRHYAWQLRGTSLANCGRLEEAALSFDSAFYYGFDIPGTSIITNNDSSIIARPNAHRAWSLTAKTLMVDGQYERAAVCFDSALAYPGDRANSLCFRGRVSAELNNNDYALSCLDSALTYNNPPHAAWLSNLIWRHRAIVLRSLGRLDEALASIDSALSYKQNDSTSVAEKDMIVRGIADAAR